MSRVGEDFEFGFTPQGGVSRFAMGFPSDRSLPWEGPSDVFGFEGADCSCPVVNFKNASMLILGGAIGLLGPKTGNKGLDTALRVAGIVVAGLGGLDIVNGFVKDAPVNGLGSEWYKDTETNHYLNKFAGAIQSRFAYNGVKEPKYGCTTCEGLGDCPSCMMGVDGLGQIEYWIFDPEDRSTPLLKMQCPPFMVAPGYVIAKKGPKGVVQEIPVEPPTMWGLSGLGFWEVLAPDGSRIAASRCRPFESDNTLTIKQVARGREVLRQSGAAPYPEGTVRRRRGPLMTSRRG